MSTKGQDDQPERVRTYDREGQPHDDVLRTPAGRVLTEAELQRLADEAQEGHPDAPDPAVMYGGWASAIDRWMDQTGTCHYQLTRWDAPSGYWVVSFACGVQARKTPIYAGGTYPTREACERTDGTHACQVCLTIEDQHPATPGWEHPARIDAGAARKEDTTP